MKSLIDFESTQPFVARFFTQALSSNSLVNSYILKGKDMAASYKVALRLAQIINCANPQGIAAACGECQSCRWIDENAHPGVITVSNLTFLTHVDPTTGLSRSKTGKAQRQIVVEQLDNLLQELALHSGGFHRVVILTGAHEVPAAEDTPDAFVPPKDWNRPEGTALELLPLDRKLFPDVLSNKFLKTLEEPPKDVMFFLLTDGLEKLLETIVSRCQTVPFATPPNYYQVSLSPVARQMFEQLAQEIQQGNYMRPMHTLVEYVNETGMASPDVLTQFQEFLSEQMTRLPLEYQRFQMLKSHIQKVERAKTMIQDKVREEAALEDLFLSLTY